MKKTVCNIEKVHELRDAMDKINKLPLADIIWHKNGQTINVSPEMVEQFKFYGLNNMDFILSEFYKKDFVKEGK